MRPTATTAARAATALAFGVLVVLSVVYMANNKDALLAAATTVSSAMLNDQPADDAAVVAPMVPIMMVDARHSDETASKNDAPGQTKLKPLAATRGQARELASLATTTATATATATAAVTTLKQSPSPEPTPLPYSPLPHVIAHEIMPLPQRRNEDLVVFNGTLLLAYGGRSRPSLDVYNMTNGTLVIHRDDPLLEINHAASVVVGDEVYVMCGLSSGVTDTEVNRDDMLIIESASWTVRRGPRLLLPRGSCGTAKLTLQVNRTDARVAEGEKGNFGGVGKQWQETLLCILGGSVGSHDQGVKQRAIDCYSKKTNSWFVMPDMPLPADHMDAFAVDERRVIVANGQSKNYGGTVQIIHEFNADTRTWRAIGETLYPRAAAGSVLYAGRYLITAAGHGFIPGAPGRADVKYNSIEWFDMQTGRSQMSSMHLVQRRFALRATIAFLPVSSTSAARQPVLLACGGTPAGLFHYEDIADCEVFGINQLLGLPS